MALGTPVVSTSKGAQGLDVSNGEHILLGDVPADFANCVISLLRDKKLRQNLAANAREKVQAEYDWTNSASRYEKLIETILV
jgi:glycosyltransferase involved in cell wall biosynthesis